MATEDLTLLERLQAYANKVDDPARLAQFQTFGPEHYADAEFLNTLRDGLIYVLQNGGGGGTAIDQDNIAICKNVFLSLNYTAGQLATAINNLPQFTVTEKQLLLVVSSVIVTDDDGFHTVQAKAWIIIGKGKGTYGFLGSNQLTSANLQSFGYINMPGMNDVNEAGNTIEGDTTWIDGTNSTKVESKGFTYKNNGFEANIRFDDLSENGGIVTFPVPGPVEKAAYQSFVLDQDNQIIDGAPAEYNTLNKIAIKLQSISAIIGSGTSDIDNVVNTVAEILQVFSTYPEGANIATALAGKINTTDIINTLTQTVTGKVLDATQGKVLKDLIDTLTTTVNGKLTGTQANDTETQATSLPSVAGKYIDTIRFYNWSISTRFRDLVRGVLLTGIVFTTGGDITAADSILVAIGKLENKIRNKAVAADYDSTPTDVIKLPTVKSIVDWKNAIGFWKSSFFAGTGSRILQTNATGDISASVQILTEDIYVTDNDILTAIASATFNSGNGFTATVTPANSKVLKAGQYCKTTAYKYEAMAGDNIVTRIPLG